MLEKDPSKRWTMAACFNHPWIQNCSKNAISPLAVTSLRELKNRMRGKKLQKSIIAVIVSQFTKAKEL